MVFILCGLDPWNALTAGSNALALSCSSSNSSISQIAVTTLALRGHWVPLCWCSLEPGDLYRRKEKPRNLGVQEEEEQGCDDLMGCVGPNGSWELDMCLSEKREYWASSKQEVI